MEGTSTVYCLQRGELSPSKLSTILSTLLSTMQCSSALSARSPGATVYNTLCNTACNALYLESALSHYYFLTTSFLLLSHYHFHFLVTITFSLLLVSSSHLLYLNIFNVLELFRLFYTFRYVSLVFATLHFEKAWKSCDYHTKQMHKLRIVSKSYASYLEIVVFEGRSLPRKPENR